MALVAFLSIMLLAVFFQFWGRGRVVLLIEETSLNILRQTSALEQAFSSGAVLGDAQALHLLDVMRTMSRPSTLQMVSFWTVLAAASRTRTKARGIPWEAGNPALEPFQIRFGTTMLRFVLARHPLLAGMMLGVSPFLSGRALEERRELMDAVSNAIPDGAPA